MVYATTQMLASGANDRIHGHASKGSGAAIASSTADCDRSSSRTSNHVIADSSTPKTGTRYGRIGRSMDGIVP